MPALAAEDSDSFGLRLVSVKLSTSPQLFGRKSAVGLDLDCDSRLCLLVLSGLPKLTNASPVTLHVHIHKQQQYISKHRKRERKKTHPTTRCVVSEGTPGNIAS